MRRQMSERMKLPKKCFFFPRFGVGGLSCSNFLAPTVRNPEQPFEPIHVEVEEAAAVMWGPD